MRKDNVKATCTVYIVYIVTWLNIANYDTVS